MKSLPFRALGIIALGLALQACGKGKSGAVAPASDAVAKSSASAAAPPVSAKPHVIEVATSEILAQGPTAHVTCADPTACSPSVAQLIATIPPQTLGECTAFLVAPDVAMTNSHCIPDELKIDNHSCKDRIWLHFPAAGGHAPEIVGCSEILTASQLKEGQTLPDYAVLHLERAVTDRPPLEISREGFADQAPITIEKMNPLTGNDIGGTLQVALCNAIHNSGVAPNSGSDLSAVMAMANCQVIHGNSGSPLLDPEGKVRGIIQSTMETPDMKKLAESYQMDFPAFAPLGGSTSFACLKLPAAVPAPPPPAACANSAQLTAASDNGELNKKVNTMTGGLSPVFAWTSEALSDTGAIRDFAFRPTCVANGNALLLNKTGKFGISTPGFRMKFSLNRFYVLSEEAIPPPSGSSTIIDDPAAFGKTGSTPIAVQWVDGKTYNYDPIRACGKAAAN